MIRTYKFRLYPTPAQGRALSEWLDFACDLYNAILQQRREVFSRAATYRDAKTKKSVHEWRVWDNEHKVWRWTTEQPAKPDKYSQSKELTLYRQSGSPYPAGMAALVQHQVITRVDLAFQAFFRRVKEGKGRSSGYPRYRSRRRYDSLTFGLDAPSRTTPVPTDEWIAEHHDLIDTTSQYLDEQLDRRKLDSISPKEIASLLNVTLPLATKLRVAAIKSLSLVIPRGITSGAGRLTKDGLHLAGLGLFPLMRAPRKPKSGQYGLRYHRGIPEDAIPRSAILTRSCGRWYVCIALELPEPPVTNATRERPPAGVDMGVITWATVYSDDAQAISGARQGLDHQVPKIQHSDGDNYLRIDGARAQESHAKRVRRHQRTIARRTRRGHTHSQRRKKAVDLYARAKERERNMRADHRHKVTRVISQHFGLIGVEDLDIAKMTKAPRNETEQAREGKGPARLKEALNRKVLDQAWYLARLALTYKAEDAGGRVQAVPPEYTTQTCAQCGSLVPKPPSLRGHICPYCRYTAPRTVNSARNVLRLATQRPDGAHPSGDNGPGRRLRTTLPSAAGPVARGSATRGKTSGTRGTTTQKGRQDR